MMKGYDVTKYDRPSVALDVLLFTIQENQLQILLVRRKEEPFQGEWAFPGGFVKMNESLEVGAARELREETGLKDIYLEQLYTFGNPKRDPRTRVISVAYLALAAKTDWAIMADTDASEAKFWPVSKLPKLAFDHQEIFEYGLSRLGSKLNYTNIAFGLLPDQFTLTELQNTYEIILNKKLDKRNFRKKILSTDLLSAVGQKSSSGAHRPAELFRFKKKEIEYLN